MKLDEKQIKQNEVFNGHLLHVYDDEVELPNGEKTRREVVRHPGGACVCAIDNDLNVTLVRQYRYAYGEELLELPAGKLDPGERPYDCAMRELREETGLVASELFPLGEMYPSPGYSDEVLTLYMAIHFEKQEKQKLDANEFVNVEKMPFGEAMQMVMNGDLKDAKTQVGLLKSYLMLDQLNQAAEQAMREEAGKEQQ